MPWAKKEDIFNGVLGMLNTNLAVKEGERLVVASDIPRQSDWQEMTLDELRSMLERAELARQVAMIASEQFPQSRVEYLAFPATGGHGREVEGAAAARLAEADVVVAITTYSITHTNARTQATAAGARFASMPEFEARMFAPGGPLAADASQVAELAQRFAALLETADQVELKTPSGTHLRFSIAGRPGRADDGLYHTPGRWGNLPAGEAYAVPVEGSGSGRLVVPAGWHPKLKEEMVFQIEKGMVVELQGGGAVGDQFRGLLRLGSPQPMFKNRRNLAELGVGCNPNAHRPDNVLEAEKILGTVHIGIGDNLHMGGLIEADLHEDFVQPEPFLYLDGQLVIQKGKWLI